MTLFRANLTGFSPETTPSQNNAQPLFQSAAVKRMQTRTAVIKTTTRIYRAPGNRWHSSNLRNTPITSIEWRVKGRYLKRVSVEWLSHRLDKGQFGQTLLLVIFPNDLKPLEEKG